MTARLSHIFMLTSDLLAERRLLVDLIGLTVLLEEDRYLRIGAPTGFHVGLEEGRPGPSDGTEINIEVDDVDHVFARLEAAGVATEGSPEREEWGARHVWFRDVDGRRMSIFSMDGP
jgi:catechol 2,3-dioxygenase-like lactoylglutathione lyase family enzyme